MSFYPLGLCVDDAKSVNVQVGEKMFKISKKQVKEQFTFKDHENRWILLSNSETDKSFHFYARYGGYEFFWLPTEENSLAMSLTIKETCVFTNNYKQGAKDE
jgi:hypothetical protein